MSSNTNPTPNSAESKIVDYSKLIPFVSAGLVLLGVSKLIIYYNLFGINVLPFLEFSEIITSFLDFIVTNTLTFALLWVIITWLPQRDENVKQLKRKFYNSIIFFLIVIILMIPVFYHDRKMFGPLIILLTIAFIPFLFFYGIYQKSNSRLIKDLCLLTIVLTTLEGLVISTTISDYRNVKNKKKYYGTRIVFNNDTFLNDSSHTLNSDSSNFYIGQSKNYIFIHHLKEGTTSVYPMSSVVHMEIKRKNQTSWLSNLID